MLTEYHYQLYNLFFGSFDSWNPPPPKMLMIKLMRKLTIVVRVKPVTLATLLKAIIKLINMKVVITTIQRQDLLKIESPGEYKIFCYKGGINLKREVDVEMGGGLPMFYYFTVQSHLLCVWRKQGSLYYFSDLHYFQLTIQVKILIRVFIVRKPGIICTFLIHSGSQQKMLTALFNVV